MIDFEEAPLSRGAFFMFIWGLELSPDPRVPVKHPAGTRGWHEYLLNIRQELADGTRTCLTSCRNSWMARVPVKHPAGTRGRHECLLNILQELADGASTC